LAKPLTIPLGSPAIFEFRGPDATRFLNGQVTQDVRLVTGSTKALPSCITDAKGRLQFRVYVMAAPEDEGLWVLGPAERADDLEARLTRYLIADDVEVRNLCGCYLLTHLIPPPEAEMPATILRESRRFGEVGADCLVPVGAIGDFGPDRTLLEGDALEHFRISRGIPAWGAELVENLLPPEAGLDRTDISYAKGCYIGQEVISRIKSAGKVNRTLMVFLLDSSAPAAAGDALVGPTSDAGILTSVSPIEENGRRVALGYVKRGADSTSLRFRDAQGIEHPAPLASLPMGRDS
jgi:folate-binding protein YgfZ